MKKTGFTKHVRGALKFLSDGQDAVTNAQLSEYLDLVSDIDKRPMYSTLIDMRKSGEIVRISPGVHRYVGRPDPNEKRRVMWRAIRAMRQSGQAATIEDMVEIAGVSKDYAQEFLCDLVRLGVARRVGPGNKAGKFVLIKDQVAIPGDDRKIERLRKIREQKKAARSALINAQNAVAEALGMVAAIEEEV